METSEEELMQLFSFDFVNRLKHARDYLLGKNNNIEDKSHHVEQKQTDMQTHSDRMRQHEKRMAEEHERLVQKVKNTGIIDKPVDYVPNSNDSQT